MYPRAKLVVRLAKIFLVADLLYINSSVCSSLMQY
jgi:hypothetical protein